MKIRKLFKAEMAHNVPGAYTTRCHYLHGHSYKFELFVRSTQPNSSQMVADFKALKEMGLNDFFDSFDHTVTVWEKDALAKIVGQVNPERHLVVPFIPTAEMLAKGMFVVAQAILQSGKKLSEEQDVEVDHVLVHETDTGYGSFGLEDLDGDGFLDIQFEKWIFSKGIQSAWKNKAWYNQALSHLKKEPVSI